MKNLNDRLQHFFVKIKNFSFNSPILNENLLKIVSLIK